MRSWILCVPIVLATTLDAHAREWTSASGTHKFDAELLGVSRDVVRLRLNQGGSVYSLPLKALSSADNKYIRENARGRKSTGSPSDAFYAYQGAVTRASSLGQVKRFFSQGKKDWWKKMDTDERKELASLKKFLIDEAEVTRESIDGNTAKVSVRGKGRVSSGKIKVAYGRFTMVKEGGAWKIDSKNISIGGHNVILVPIR